MSMHLDVYNIYKSRENVGKTCYLLEVVFPLVKFTRAPFEKNHCSQLQISSENQSISPNASESDPNLPWWKKYIPNYDESWNEMELILWIMKNL